MRQEQSRLANENEIQNSRIAKLEAEVEVINFVFFVFIFSIFKIKVLNLTPLAIQICETIREWQQLLILEHLPDQFSVLYERDKKCKIIIFNYFRIIL